jgi:EAL domain-containing protein (putative c-di-GMP-specific phosphodiesterase class I)
VEITETALLGSDPATSHAIGALRDRGVHLVLDDFGTGFSSLSMLKEQPIDGIKIDRSFVAGLPEDASSGAIVAAVVGMAHALGRTVTAEGIESGEQLAFLKALGCDLAQGYLLGRPMPFDALAALLGEGDRADAAGL